MSKCYLCESVGIITVADSPEKLEAGPVRDDGTRKAYHVCKGCFVTHHRALDRGMRTMFDRMFSLPGVRGRANATPRQAAGSKPGRKSGRQPG